MAGVTPTGFVKKTLEDILSDIQDAQRATFGASLDAGTTTALGQMNGTFASALAECWEILEEAFHGFDPDAAADYLLTVLAGLTGTDRRGAKASTVTLTLSLNAGATVNAGALVAHSSRPDIQFTTDVSVTNSGGSPATFPVTATCTKTGPLAALAGSLTVIVNAVSGWTAVTNSADAALGRDVDSDIVLRQRRADQLALRGGSTVAAVRADLLALTDMRTAIVLENTDDTVDPSTGLPPHSVAAIIDDGDTPTIPDTTIAQTIWDSKAGGIKAYGSTTANATDENGDPQPVGFSRATLRPVYIDLSLTTTADFPVDGDDQVKAAIVAAGAGYGIDELVIALHLRAAALTVAGVTDVPAFTLGFAPSPVGTGNLSPGQFARATFDSTNITI